MALKGDLASFSLTEIFQSIRVNQRSGTLEVSDGEQTRAVYFAEGTIAAPEELQDPGKLGEILVRKKKITEGDLAEVLAAADGGRASVIAALRDRRGVTDAEIRAIQREAVEESLYDLFLWDDAYFEFRKDELPPSLQQGRISLNTESILMEAALRVDEWRRITEVIPSLKYIFRISDEFPEKMPQTPVPFDRMRLLLGGDRNVKDIALAVGASKFDVCRSLYQLHAAKVVRPCRMGDVEIAFQDAMQENDHERAVAYFEYALELGPHARRLRDRMMTALLSERSFVASEARHRISGSVDKIDFTRFFLTLVLKPHRGVLRLRDRSGERTFYLSPDQIWVGSGGERQKLPLGSYLVRRRAASRIDVDLALTLQRQGSPRRIGEILVEMGAAKAEDVDQAVRAQVLEQIFDAFLWRGAHFEFDKNAPPPEGDRSFARLELSDANVRREIVKNLDRFGDIMQTISSSRAIFVADDSLLRAQQKAAGEIERGVLSLVDGRRTVQEILRAGKGSLLDVAEFLYYLALRKVIRSLTPPEMKAAVERAIQRSDLAHCVRICDYALELGSDPEWFATKLEEIKLKNPDFLQTTREYKLEGDIETFGLAELFQSLHLNKHSGTLKVSDGRRERLIYFSEGIIYLLSRGVREVSRIGDLLLDAGRITEQDLARALAMQEASQPRRLLGEILVELGVVTMEEILQAVKAKIRDELFDVFIWENARFEFTKNYLPDAFFGTAGPVTKIEMETGEILLEAMQRLQEWEEIERALGTDRAFLRATAAPLEGREIDPTARRLLPLLDGRHTTAQVVAASGLGKFKTSRLLRELVDAGAARPLARSELAAMAEQAFAEKDFELCVRYYEYASLLDQETEALLKRFVDLAFGEGKGMPKAPGKRVVFKGGGDIAEILRGIAQGRKSGTIHATDGVSERTIYLNPEVVIIRSKGPRQIRRLGQVVVDREMASEAAVERGLAAQAKLGLRLGETLVEQGALTKERLLEALKEQATEALIDLTQWTGAAIRFEENQIPQEILVEEKVTRIEVDVGPIVEAAVARKEAWEEIQRTIPSDRLILSPAPEAARSLAAARHLASPLLPLLDGKRTVAQILASEGGRDPFPTWSALYAMLKDGAVRKLPRADAFSRLTQARLVSDTEYARSLLQHVLALEPGDVEAKEALAGLEAGAEQVAANLTDVLKALLDAYRQGTVTCTQGDVVRKIYLGDHELLMIGHGGGPVAPRIGEVLVLDGRASREKVEAAAAFQVKTRASRRIGEILTLQGVCTEAAIQAGLREQALVGLRDTFRLKEAQVEFKPGVKDPDFASPTASVFWFQGDPVPLLREALEREEGWRVIEETGIWNELILVPIADVDHTPPKNDAVYQLVDGQRRVDEIINQTDRGRYQVLRQLATLVQRALLRPLGLDEARKRALAVYMEGDQDQARKLFEYVAVLDPNDDKARRYLDRIKRSAK